MVQLLNNCSGQQVADSSADSGCRQLAMVLLIRCWVRLMKLMIQERVIPELRIHVLANSHNILIDILNKFNKHAFVKPLTSVSLSSFDKDIKSSVRSSFFLT